MDNFAGLDAASPGIMGLENLAGIRDLRITIPTLHLYGFCLET